MYILFCLFEAADLSATLFSVVNAERFTVKELDKLQEEKNEFLKTVVPKWKEEATKREATYTTTIQ